MSKTGRPLKENADYFPHDANASDDIKLKALESRMGADGYALYFKTLEILTKSNKFQLEISKNYIREGLPQTLKISVELFENFLKNAIELELLVHDEKGFLFSKGLKKRLQVLVKYRRYDRERKKTFPAGKVPEKNVKIGSKVKESKVKESKEKNKETTADLKSVKEIWNNFAEKNNLSKILEVTEQRAKSILNRKKEKEFDLIKILGMITDSDFLKGNNKEGWKVDFDFVFCSPNNYLKILEGKYNGKSKPNGVYANNITEKKLRDIAEGIANDPDLK